MSSLATDAVPHANQVRCTDEEIVVSLSDGRTLSVPIVWFPRLAGASQAQREDYELLGGGEGVHWPQVDEDISVAGLLMGQRSAELRHSL
ncbi:MAG TPA: DUF2442 domain-containing protein [Gammaproteobacteria bacterium]|nr:DUF2442 domain-containing protein [Gammaproteobacteria bacterium]